MCDSGSRAPRTDECIEAVTVRYHAAAHVLHFRIEQPVRAFTTREGVQVFTAHMDAIRRFVAAEHSPQFPRYAQRLSSKGPATIVLFWQNAACALSASTTGLQDWANAHANQGECKWQKCANADRDNAGQAGNASESMRSPQLAAGCETTRRGSRPAAAASTEAISA